MPQLDLVAFFSTVLWQAILASLIIILVLVYILPNLVSLLKLRKLQTQIKTEQ